MDVKKDFGALSEGLIYLDNASTTQKPQVVVDSIERFYRESNANVHRGVYKLAEKADKEYDAARQKVANFINCNFKEVIFTSGTTGSLNNLAYSIDSLIGDGRDEIVISVAEHHSNLVPWQELALRKGMKLKVIRFGKDLTLDMDHAREIIGERTALVAVAHVSSVLGVEFSVREICEVAREKGAISVVDAAQSVGKMKVDVKEIGCDFLVFSGHKMLGPMGIGVLYGRRELLDKMRPFQFGGGMIREVDFEKSSWGEVPLKFEAGTPNVAGAVGLGHAIDYLNEEGLEKIEEHIRELTESVLKGMKEVERVRVFGSGQKGTVSFSVGALHPHDVATLMDGEGIAIRGGHHCSMPLMKELGVAGTCRVSFHIYNVQEDVSEFLRVLKEIVRRVGK